MNTQRHDDGSLASRYRALLDHEPKLRIRNASERLGVSELELLMTGVTDDVTPLRCDPAGILGALEPVGEVMALTRNVALVHEKIGVYRNVSFEPYVGLVLDEQIDLRIFPRSWKYALAVTTPGARGERHSLQFFDAHGRAVHKIYRRDATDGAAWDNIVARWTDASPAPLDTIEPPPGPSTPSPDTEIDVAGFQQAWRDLRDTHEFFGLLREYGVTRTQALRLAPQGYARAVAPSAFRTVLQRSAEGELPIMVFVNSPGCIQIHTGPVAKLVETGPWYNVLDPDFNLHARDGLVAQAWHVRKPTEDGDVNSLELFDADGELLAMLFGARKPGVPELDAWRELTASLPET